MLYKCNLYGNQQTFLCRWGSSYIPKEDNSHLINWWSRKVIWLDSFYQSIVIDTCHLKYFTCSHRDGLSLILFVTVVVLHLLKHGNVVLSSGNTFRQRPYATIRTLADMLYNVYIEHFYTPSTSSAFHGISKLWKVLAFKSPFNGNIFGANFDLFFCNVLNI